MSNMLNQQQTLTKLKVELEGRKEKKCFGCKGLGHLAYNCRNQKEIKKRRSILHNKFKVLVSRVIKYDVRKKVKVKRQEKKKLQCFRY